LSTRYFLFKLNFIRFCKIPNYYTEAMNDRACVIVQITIVIHMGISIWMFGVT
jgi:hypothetical protein